MTIHAIREAITELTAPVVHHVPQIDDAGTWLKTSSVWLPSLLDQLSEAVTSTMGGQGNGSTLKHARQIIDSDALHMFLKIKSQIIDWCIMAGVKPGKDAAENLMLWGDAIEVEDGGFYARTMREWANQIRTKLDPPKRMEILHPCVVCEATVWVDDDGETRPHPVEASYRPDEGEVKIMCRACKTVWDGPDAAKELGEEIAEMG